MLNARLISRLEAIDWDFSGKYSESPFSAIHWHPGRYASQVPATLVGLLTEQGDHVLDPFAGSGTTLIEAQRLGRVATGIDLAPIACMAAQGKTLALSAGRIAALADELVEDARRLLAQQLRVGSSRLRTTARVPETVQSDKWYTPRVRADLGTLFGRIQTYSGRLRQIADVAFSGILLPVCRETRHWGYVCDNSTPKGEAESDVLSAYQATLARLRLAYEARDRDRSARGLDNRRIEPCNVICGDAVKELQQFGAETFDLVVTSPPYYGVCDYAKSQRLSMEWFGHDIERVRRNEIGARSKRRRPTSRRDYVDELSAVLGELSRVTRAGGVLAVVIGESKSREPVLKDVRRALGHVGFSLKADINRRVSSQRRQAPSVYREHVLILSRETLP